MTNVIKFRDRTFRARPHDGEMFRYYDKIFGNGIIIAIFHVQLDAQAYAGYRNQLEF